MLLFMLKANKACSHEQASQQAASQHSAEDTQAYYTAKFLGPSRGQRRAKVPLAQPAGRVLRVTSSCSNSQSTEEALKLSGTW